MKRVFRAKPYIPEADIQPTLALIRQSLVTGQLTNGDHVKALEKEFAAAMGVHHAIAVSTGTAALEISLRAINVSGREVILPTETFVASANSIIVAGGTPVFAEIHPDTYCLDLEDVKRKISDRTAAVMLVHMAGLIVPNIAQFQELCAERGIDLIEDAAHAHGASHAGTHAGAFGRAGCFSFFPTKILTSAEGGMITTNDDSLARLARSLRNHGADPDGGSEYTEVSTNMRIAEPLAAIGLIQLRRLEEFVSRRNAIARRYNEGLARIAGIRLLPPTGGVHSYWNYLAVLDEKIDRTAFSRLLREKYGVDSAWPYEPACHLQPVFRRVLGTKPGDLPRSESLLRHHITFPMHGALTDEEVEQVIDGVKRTLDELRNS